MFATRIYPTKNPKLDTYIQDLFIGMIEIGILDYLRSCWDGKESLEEYLDAHLSAGILKRR